jgi:16S rRNA C1402 (ribose-2'-O) methylase RsmI
MNKNELFELAIKNLNTDNGVLEGDFTKLIEPLTTQQQEKIREKVDYTENNKGKLVFFLYEEDAIELRAWVLTEK